MSAPASRAALQAVGEPQGSAKGNSRLQICCCRTCSGRSRRAGHSLSSPLSAQGRRGALALTLSGSPSFHLQLANW